MWVEDREEKKMKRLKIKRKRKRKMENILKSEKTNNGIQLSMMCCDVPNKRQKQNFKVIIIILFVK